MNFENLIPTAKKLLGIGLLSVFFVLSAQSQGRPQLNNSLQRLPSVVRWVDNGHFILSRTDPTTNKNEFTLVEAKTGKEKSYTLENASPQKSKASNLRTIGNEVYLIGADNKQVQLTFDHKEKAQNPLFSPDSNYVAYTRGNNLFAINIATKKETQLTNDGSDVILNGYASWVYMEEILGRSTNYKAFWWSPDSKSLVFYRFDESKVPNYTISNTGILGEETIIQRYPHPGENNPEVRVGLVSPTGGAVIWADFDAKVDQYFGTPQWLPNSEAVLIQWLNRGQDDYQLYAVSPKSGEKELLYEEKQPTWIDLDKSDRITFVEGSNDFILSSDKSGHPHLYFYSFKNRKIHTITQGDFNVKSIRYMDLKNKVIYFTANKETIVNDDLYRIDFSGKNFKRLTFGDYNHRVQFSPDAQYFFSTYSNVDSPEQLALLNNQGKLIKAFGDSRGADFNLAKAPIKEEIIYVDSEDGKFKLPMRISYPANMVAGKKYPVEVAIYGGPNTSGVSSDWRSSRMNSRKDEVIYAYLDHRGSTEFGKVGQNYLHRNLGYWELKDWTEQVKWLIKNRQADPSRVLISGFSYGGYMTCYAMVNAPDVFTHGIAGGSVTDWHLYDTHYTERYMDTPQENPEGYKSSSVLFKADQLKGPLLLIHGMADDNVHVQNTLDFVSKLQDADKDFEMMLYPVSKHGIGGSKAAHYNKENRKFRERYNFIEKKD